jgi:hypothetical protein
MTATTAMMPTQKPALKIVPIASQPLRSARATELVAATADGER